MSEPNGADDFGARKPNKSQKKFAIGAAIIVGTIVYLMYTGVQASSVYYHTVDEVLAMSSLEKKMALRMEGTVKPGTIEKDAANMKLTFKIIDESLKSIPVYYQGIAPDMFQDDIDVVVEGKFSSDGRFVASRLLTSCPSKYEAAEELKQSL